MQWLQEWLVKLFLAFLPELLACLIYLSSSLPLSSTHSLSISLSLLLFSFLLTSTLQWLHVLSFNLYLHSVFFSSPECFSLFLSWLGCCFSSLLLSRLGYCFSSLFLYLPVPGAMANHLITNALLRPHGTNNPYNTLLGDSAVYNNPAVGMYNTQGVADVPFMNNIFKCSIELLYFIYLLI